MQQTSHNNNHQDNKVQEEEKERPVAYSHASQLVTFSPRPPLLPIITLITINLKAIESVFSPLCLLSLSLHSLSCCLLFFPIATRIIHCIYCQCHRVTGIKRQQQRHPRQIPLSSLSPLPLFASSRVLSSCVKGSEHSFICICECVYMSRSLSPPPHDPLIHPYSSECPVNSSSSLSSCSCSCRFFSLSHYPCILSFSLLDVTMFVELKVAPIHFKLFTVTHVRSPLKQL